MNDMMPNAVILMNYVVWKYYLHGGLENNKSIELYKFDNNSNLWSADRLLKTATITKWWFFSEDF